MNTIEKIDRAIEDWVHNLRGSFSDSTLQPKDVLHTILQELEANRIEGLDNQFYAPNYYVIELHLDDEERARLLPFIGREDLETAIRAYCEKHKYLFRGPLELRVVAEPQRLREERLALESDEEPTEEKEKIRVVSRFEVNEQATVPPALNTMDWEAPEPLQPAGR